MLKYLFALLFVSMHISAFAQNVLSDNDLQRLDQTSTVITKQMSNDRVTLDLILTLWNTQRLDAGVQDVYRDIKNEHLNRFGFREDFRDAERWKRDTRISANQHCFILINNFEIGTGRRIIYFGCGLETAATLGVDDYRRSGRDFYQYFSRAYQRAH